jgi:endo-1,4-beta-xylanase
MEEAAADGGDDGPTLKQVVADACKRIDIGTAVLPKPLFTSDAQDFGEDDLEDFRSETANEASAESTSTYARVLQSEFNSIVVEHHLKWAPMCTSEPGPLPGEKPSDRLGRYDFHHADAIVDWALERDIKVKGHVLVWHITSPKFLEDLEPADIRMQLKRHIYTVMGHYRGRIHVWDVVNEALAPDGTLAETVFFRKLGPEYIEDCFRWAHEADSSATLLYNDNKVEGIDSKKGEGFYELLADLKAKSVPVHGCGMQAHFDAAGVGWNRPPTPRMVKQQIRRLGELGLTVNISEMDVRVSKLPANLQQLAQRQIYHDILAAALSEPAFDGIYLWGFTDRHTWVTHFYHDDEPLVFDENYGRKESYYGLRDALATMTPGGTVGGEGVLLTSDVDVNGNKWGHQWMQPEPNPSVWEEQNAGAVGNARPDWEQVSAAEGRDSSEGEGGETTDDDDLGITTDNDEDLPPIS